MQNTNNEQSPSLDPLGSGTGAEQLPGLEEWEVELESPDYFAVVEVREGASDDEILEAAIAEMTYKTSIWKKRKTSDSKRGNSATGQALRPATGDVRARADAEPQVRSSAWVGDAPPATPDSEGWWWVVDTLDDEERPLPADVRLHNGDLHVRVFGWEYSVLVNRCGLRWGGRLAVNGASPAGEAHRQPPTVGGERKGNDGNS